MWTEEQKNAIEERGKNILVSAAAGSGKTTVMVERIKQLVLSGKEDIDRFLITTFTSAAASDMKKKLEKSIRDELKSMEPGNPDRSFLLRQIYLLTSASISTFHSFATNMIREYFYLTDLEPGFAIGDEVETTIMEKEAIDSVFERHYEDRNDEEFREFLIRRSSDRNDKALKATITETYKKLRSIPDYFQWVDSKTEKLMSENPFEELGLKAFVQGEREQATEEALRYMEEALSYVNENTMPVIRQKIFEDVALIEASRRLGDADFKDFAAKPGFNAMRAPKDEKDAWEAVKEDVNQARDKGKKCFSDLKKKYFYAATEELNEELNRVSGDSQYLIDLIKEFEEEFWERKKQKNILDFDDVMHFALEILKDEKAAEEISEKYRYIFIDEYQDSNFLQEAIIGRIAKSNNLFMVGDVKQSIYRFRLAEPEIFIKTAHNYRSGDNENSTVIDLNSNFRSKESVTEAVNAVFRGLMPGYGEADELHCTQGESDYKTRLHIIDGESLKEDNIEKIDAEGKLAVDLIRHYILEGFDYKDIAVLSRGGTSVGELENFLINEGIPAYGEKSEGYFESVEIQVFINLLKTVDNMRQDVPLISVMRSVLFNFTFNEMAIIRSEHMKGSFCEAVRDYRENGSNEVIKAKVENLISSIEYRRELARTMSLEDFIKRMLYDTGYYDYCSSLPVGKQRISNLRLIVEKAASYERTNHRGLSGFLRYIEAMGDAGITVSEAKTLGENENVVRIMTVHKSKGLEFPVVILVGAGKKVTGGKAEKVALHKDFGIGLDLVDRENRLKKKTILQNVITGKKTRENLDEEIRILYVAMTRAEDCLEIVGTEPLDSLKSRQTKGSYIDMIYPVMDCVDRGEVLTYEMPPEISSESVFNNVNGIIEEAANPPESQAGLEAVKRLSFVYPYENSGVKTKYSVSELAGEAENVKIPLAEFNPERKGGNLTAAQRGTAIHKLMERLDFAKALEGGIAYVESFADEIAAQGILTVAERENVNIGNVVAFFETDIGRRAAEAFDRGDLRREQEFIMKMDIKGNTAVLQGIIDCCFEENGKVILIDYKNTSAPFSKDDDKVREYYMEQIDLYREALTKATDIPVSESYIYLFERKRFVLMD